MFTQLKNIAAHAAVVFIMGWMCFALSFQLYFLTGMALGQDDKLRVVADELTVTVICSVVPLFIPVPIMMLGLFASTIQALIFATLASAYIGEVIE